MKYIALCCNARSGLHMAMGLLERATSVSTLYEPMALATDQDPLLRGDEDNAKRLQSIAEGRGKKISAFALRSKECRLRGSSVGGILKALGENAYPIILDRRNKLDQWLSHKLALCSNKWAGAHYGDTKVQWDPIDFIGWAEEDRNGVQEHILAAAKTGKPVVVVYYEDICKNPGHFLEKIFDAIGESIETGAEVQNRWTKQRDLPFMEYISNPIEAEKDLSKLPLSLSKGVVY